MSTKSIAVFGGSFNPPGAHHRTIAQLLSEQYDEVLVVPCGPRPDKPVTNDVDPVYRAAMVDMTFRDLERVHVELFDLEECTFTRAVELERRFADRGSIWHVVGADLIQGGRNGQSAIQTQWQDGKQLWEESRFAVIRREGFELDPADLPPYCQIFGLDCRGASSSIRSQIFHEQPVDGLLTPEVDQYIKRHGLYRGVNPSRRIKTQLSGRRFMLVVDQKNPSAVEAAQRLGTSYTQHPDLIVVIGGDGTMLRAIRQHWRTRVPFYGYNTGHLGFLLNDRLPNEALSGQITLQHVPLLYVETELADGTRHHELAFNDAWIERATGQTAAIQVKINGQQRIERVVADGMLVSTAAGSASYARAMGATPLPVGTPAMLLVGSNVLRPLSFQAAVLPLDANIELRTLDPVKRPIHCYIDGVSQGAVVSMRVRQSNIAGVELAFDPAQDPLVKLAKIQFPATDWE